MKHFIQCSLGNIIFGNASERSYIRDTDDRFWSVATNINASEYFKNNQIHPEQAVTSNSANSARDQSHKPTHTHTAESQRDVREDHVPSSLCSSYDTKNHTLLLAKDHPYTWYTNLFIYIRLKVQRSQENSLHDALNISVLFFTWQKNGSGCCHGNITYTRRCEVTSPEGVRGTSQERLLTLQPLLEHLQIVVNPPLVHLDGLYGLLHDPHLRSFIPQRAEEVLSLDEKENMFAWKSHLKRLKWKLASLFWKANLYEMCFGGELTSCGRDEALNGEGSNREPDIKKKKHIELYLEHL